MSSLASLYAPPLRRLEWFRRFMPHVRAPNEFPAHFWRTDVHHCDVLVMGCRFIFFVSVPVERSPLWFFMEEDPETLVLASKETGDGVLFFPRCTSRLPFSRRSRPRGLPLLDGCVSYSTPPPPPSRRSMFKISCPAVKPAACLFSSPNRVMSLDLHSGAPASFRSVICAPLFSKGDFLLSTFGPEKLDPIPRFSNCPPTIERGLDRRSKPTAPFYCFAASPLTFPDRL